MFYDHNLEKYLIEHRVEGRILRFEGPVKTIEEAEKEAGVPKENLIKTIVFLAEELGCVACVVSGNQKVNTKKVKSLLRVKNLEIANAAEVLNLTGYPIGGVPPLGFEGRWFVDPAVLKKKEVVGGGGSANCLLKVVASEIVRCTGAAVESIGQEVVQE